MIEIPARVTQSFIEAVGPTLKTKKAAREFIDVLLDREWTVDEVTQRVIPHLAADVPPPKHDNYTAPAKREKERKQKIRQRNAVKKKQDAQPKTSNGHSGRKQVPHLRGGGVAHGVKTLGDLFPER